MAGRGFDAEKGRWTRRSGLCRQSWTTTSRETLLHALSSRGPCTSLSRSPKPPVEASFTLAIATRQKLWLVTRDSAISWAPAIKECSASSLRYCGFVPAKGHIQLVKTRVRTYTRDSENVFEDLDPRSA